MTYYFTNHDSIIRPMLEKDCKDFVKAFREQNWTKPLELFESYFNENRSGRRKVLVAEYQNEVAGYVTVLPEASLGPYKSKNIPEIVDLNVLKKFQNRGIGNRLMNVAEKLAGEMSDSVSLSVGLHSGYGTAQRMYVKRGYIPDGSGVWYKGTQLEQYAHCENNDELTLYLLKKLA